MLIYYCCFCPNTLVSIALLEGTKGTLGKGIFCVYIYIYIYTYYINISTYIYVYIYIYTYYINIYFVRSFDDRMRKSPPGAGYSDNSDNCLLHTADSTSCAGHERKGLANSDR